MKESTRICRFAVIGTLNALITAITIWVMMDELDINYMLSNVTAYILAQTHNFIWCKYWVFPTEKKSNTWRQVLLFSIAFGMAYCAQFLFLIGLVEGLNCNEYLAQFLGYQGRYSMAGLPVGQRILCFRLFPTAMGLRHPPHQRG